MIRPLAPSLLAPSTPEMRQPQAPTTPKQSFASVLKETRQPAAPLTFSGHARERLAARGIALSPETLAEAGRVVDELAQKGARESVLMLGDATLVVNVARRTVITALDSNEQTGRLFTNIDSAAVIQPLQSTST
ncbi:MAG: flagellar protein [Candidatus Hydrogenedentes bacterium]|nr:flagellar protein [Candidatus Hydrogenedentota bacterium]